MTPPRASAVRLRVVSAALALALSVVGERLGAQQSVERPVPFDSAGRVLTITPRFVERFKLGAPWAVTGAFVEARLYARSDGGFVLVVQRADGSLERTLIDEAHRQQLGAVLTGALATTGGVATIGEGANVLSEPAGSAFTRNMTVAGATIWGPAIAAMVDEYPAAAAAYLGTVGAAFFVSSGIARSGEISRAQNHMASDGAARGAAMGQALAVALGIDERGGGRPAFLLGGSLALAASGYVAGRPMSDGEAHGATWGSTYAAAVTAGALGLAGAWKSGGNEGALATTVGAALAGYPFGLRWVRRSRYAITSGDVSAIQTTSIIGAAAAATALGNGANERLVAGVLTGGFVLGAGVGAISVARPYDMTESQANQVNLGALAGGLIGLALPTLAQADDARAYLGAAAIGSSIGMAATLNMVSPRPGAGRRASQGARLRVTPWNLVGLAGGRAGDPRPRSASLLRLEF